MSERTAASLAKFHELLPRLKALPGHQDHSGLIDDAEALGRAISAFHMEAIRFRMFRVDRALKHLGDPPDTRATFEQLRQALEDAGFHTRSHTAP
jgi:hypothetical protein